MPGAGAIERFVEIQKLQKPHQHLEPHMNAKSHLLSLRLGPPAVEKSSGRPACRSLTATPMREFMLVLLLVLAAGACRQRAAEHTQASASAAPAAVKGPFTPAELQAFTSLGPIDTHTHVFVTDPAFVAMLKRLNLHLVDICVYSDIDGPLTADLPREIRLAQEFIKASDGHASLCTSFNAFPFQKPGFAQAAIRQINRDFIEGAIAVKIWKNMGMEIKDAQGRYILPDNPAYEPIYKDIAAHNKTLIAHLAEPDSAWIPLDPSWPDYQYRKDHPEWGMYGKPGAPTKAEILSARDHLVEENPNLRVVGAHLGSMESDFEGLSRTLDRYPNFAVDTAARMPYLIMLPRDRAIAFVSKYQDRLIYGTDHHFRPGAKALETVQEWENSYADDWRFFATNDWVEYRGKRYQGLNLPRPVLEKLYHSNAVHWFPGIESEKH
jgi:predicted TIM-barrel fold metal-dependent hydrolase